MGLLGNITNALGLTEDAPKYHAPRIDPGYVEQEKKQFQEAQQFNPDTYKQNRINQAQKAQGLLGGNATNEAINRRASAQYNDQMSRISRYGDMDAQNKKQSLIEKAYGYTNKINALIAKQKEKQYAAELDEIETRNSIIGSIIETGGYVAGRSMGRGNKTKSVWDIEGTPSAGQSYTDVSGRA